MKMNLGGIVPNIDIEKLERLVRDSLVSAASWVEAACGNVANKGKDATQVVLSSSIHQAFTEIDIRLQEIILTPIISEFPELLILAEEKTLITENLSTTEKEFAFICDPLDGTQSYIHGRHDYSTLLALSQRGRIIWGLIACYHPLRIVSSLAPRNNWDKHGTAESFRIACHYRFLTSAYKKQIEKLRNSGYDLSAVPLAVEEYNSPNDRSEYGLGSNGTAILAFLEGHWDAYIAPMITLHDFAAGWAIAKKYGATVMQFSTVSATGWYLLQNQDFHIKSSKNYPVRYRIVIAKNLSIAKKILAVLA